MIKRLVWLLHEGPSYAVLSKGIFVGGMIGLSVMTIPLLICVFGCQGKLEYKSRPAATPKIEKQKPPDLDKIVYQWIDGGIKTSDGRFFPLKRENIVDKDGNPILIMEARLADDPEAPSTPQRKKMTEQQIISDIWLRIQDQDLDSLALIPSKYDNEGDLRRTLVTITKKESEFLKLDVDQYRLRNGTYDKIAVPLWVILQKQEEIQKVPVKEEFQDKVKKLRKSEIPSA